jgi:hypothetical protein
VGTNVPIADYRSVLGPAASDLLELSPTAMADVQALTGKRYRIEIAAPGSGTRTDTQKHIIYIDQGWLGNAADVVTSISHEMGHGLRNVPDDLSSRENYIKGQMRGEGAAIWNEFIIGAEINAVRSGAIGIGSNRTAYKPIFDANFPTAGANPSDAVLDQIGALYETAHPSTAPAKTYRQFYSDGYDDIRNARIANNAQITAFNSRVAAANVIIDRNNVIIRRNNVQIQAANAATRRYNAQVDAANARRPPGTAALPRNPLQRLQPLQTRQTPMPLQVVPPL